MSLLVVGLSHRTAPIALLERAALDAEGSRAVARELCAPVGGEQAGDPAGERAVREATVLATCNRVEVYADVASFHRGVQDLSVALAQRVGVPLAELTQSLTFAYGDRAVEHLFCVAAGLDSMALGESQVLGQVRAALRRGQEDGTVGRVLDQLVQRALRVGKRVHSETGLGAVGRSLVEAALEGAEDLVGPLPGAHALVVGAGSMSALAVATLHRRGVGSIAVANRTPARAARLADAVGGTWLGLDDAAALRSALAVADVVVSCTGAVGTLLDVDLVAAARRERGGERAAAQLVVDLALPHDVDPAAGELDGVELVGLDVLRRRLADGEVAVTVGAARRVVAEEVGAYLAEQRAASVAPTVAALRSLARDVVEGEVARLRGRLGPEVDPRVVAEAELAVHRVTEKLLHTPTVRVKALAADGAHGAGYAAALRELFALEGGAAEGLLPESLGAGRAVAQVVAAAAATGSGSVADVLRASAERSVP